MALPRWLAIPILAVFILATGQSPVQAQDAGKLYFAETGHWVSGDFLSYYVNAADPLLVYGYPITEPSVDPLTGYTVQYFNRARLEQHPGSGQDAGVQLSPLGWLLYEAGTEVKFNTDTAACRHFEVQGFSVCYSFLDFFKANGGLDQFGYPISNLENHEGLYVQYFERARFEWHPELPAGERIVLTDLGKVYFTQRVNDPALLRPITDEGSPQPVLQLKTRAFAARAVVASNDRQTLYVVVQDQYLRPVSGAAAAMTVEFPNGSRESFTLPKTDASGISQLELVVSGQPADSVVRINVEVSREGLKAADSTWFRVWW